MGFDRANSDLLALRCKGARKRGFSGCFCKVPKITENLRNLRILDFRGKCSKNVKITGNLPETSDWGPQSDVSGKFPVISVIFGAFPAEIQNPQISFFFRNFRQFAKTPGKPTFTSPFTSQPEATPNDLAGASPESTYFVREP